jgi:hypothetical protein
MIFHYYFRACRLERCGGHVGMGQLLAESASEAPQCIHHFHKLRCFCACSLEQCGGYAGRDQLFAEAASEAPLPAPHSLHAYPGDCNHDHDHNHCLSHSHAPSRAQSFNRPSASVWPICEASLLKLASACVGLRSLHLRHCCQVRSKEAAS